MQKIHCLYGDTGMDVAVDDGVLLDVLTPALHAMRPAMSERNLAACALCAPIGSPPLSQLAQGKKRVVIITSDHTRPMPSRVTMPLLLQEIRRGSPQAEITILIATGCHRGMSMEERLARFGKEICENERIVVHDCDDWANMADLGRLPSGGPCRINRLAANADLLVAEGFIEPHFFAGFSGGRKAVLPGVASRETVLANHCAEFIDSPCARTGALEDNPIHRDMLWAADRAGLQFILNVILDGEKRIVHAVAGDHRAAHQAGCGFLKELCQVRISKEADIVIATNGGAPLDQNIYQAVKGMTAAEAAVRTGGVIIMLARSNDGHGGDAFYRTLAGRQDVEEIYTEILNRGRTDTKPDQWQAQIMLRVLKKARVVYVSEAPDDMVSAMHMTPAHSPEEALSLAKKMLAMPNPTVTVIPDGVSVILNGK